MPDSETVAARTADPAFADAYRALDENGAVQFGFTPSPPPRSSPEWLGTLGEWVLQIFRPIGRLLRAITDLMPDAPIARIVLWSLIVLGLLALLLVVIDRIRFGDWRWPFSRRANAAPERAGESLSEADLRPEAQAARRWLEEADMLAASGAHAEAIHHLLRRSIEDLSARHPRLVRPAATTRDLVASDTLGDASRTPFARIAALVERSLFARRSVDAGDWSEARAAYADFARTGSPAQ